MTLLARHPFSQTADVHDVDRFPFNAVVDPAGLQPHLAERRVFKFGHAASESREGLNAVGGVEDALHERYRRRAIVQGDEVGNRAELVESRE